MYIHFLLRKILSTKVSSGYIPERNLKWPFLHHFPCYLADGFGLGRRVEPCCNWYLNLWNLGSFSHNPNANKQKGHLLKRNYDSQFCDRAT